jgi:hypothetical protein
MKTTRAEGALLAAVILGLTAAACVDRPAPTSVDVVATAAAMPDAMDHSGAHDDKGYIGGWFDGEDVALRYSRIFFCEDPPTSGAESGCEVGADAEVSPRNGPIPVVYAIAAIGFTPPEGTAHCLGGKPPCLNHPASLDLSRVGGPGNAMAGPHSHVITSRQGGWHQTINIGVPTVEAWKQIVDAKSYEKVKELQEKGLITQDRKTNVFFFFEVQKP